MSRIKFMNTEIDNLTMQETLKVIEELIQKTQIKNYKQSTKMHL